MSLDAHKLTARIAELSKVYQAQQARFGESGYDPTLLTLLHADLTALKAQLDDKILTGEISH